MLRFSASMIRRTQPVYGLLFAVWCLIVVWQVVEHHRVQASARAAVTDRSKYIADITSSVIGSASFRGILFQDRLDHVRVVLHTERVRHGHQQRVRCSNRFVRGEFLDQRVGFGSIRTAEDGAHVVDEPNLIAIARVVSEVRAVAAVDEREDAARDRHARRALVSGFLPRLAVRLDLPSLLDVQRLAALVFLERRALEVHAEFRRPLRRGVRGGAPPDAIAQPF